MFNILRRLLLTLLVLEKRYGKDKDHRDSAMATHLLEKWRYVLRLTGIIVLLLIKAA